MQVLFVVIGVFCVLAWILLKPACATSAQRAMVEGVNHAHRGLYQKDQSIPENSLAAMDAAVAAGYGIELDIQLSKDGQIVVFHDDDLKRACGIDARVDAYSFAQLSQLSLFGTAHTMPLFSEVLSHVDGKIPLIVELKSGPQNDELCTKALAMLRTYDGPYCVESFDARIVAWFRKNAPDVMRGQLTDTPSEFKGFPWYKQMMVGCVLTNVIARPHFIAHGMGKKTMCVRLAQSMGAMRVCWTVRETDDIARIEQENDAVIFEHYLPKPHYEQ